MNLIDAVKSGKPFRRIAWQDYWLASDSWSKSFLKQDILADDWEIQEIEVKITRTQLTAAWSSALADGIDLSNMKKLLFDKLGFK